MLNLLERTNGWCDVLEHVQSREEPPKPFLNEYLPTPEEISRACLEIQSEWTELAPLSTAGIPGAPFSDCAAIADRPARPSAADDAEARRPEIRGRPECRHLAFDLRPPPAVCYSA
ncbi:MAG: hypothetical protein U0992_19610 [Planctomycetaceae bacterium]